MIDHLLKVGQVLDIPIPPKPAYTPKAVWERYSLGQFPLSITELGVLKIANRPKLGATIHWLPYLPIRITEVERGAVAIMTGPMSGCPLALYKRTGTQGAKPYFAHVGTENGMDEENEAIRSAFHGDLGKGNFDFVAGFDPWATWKTVPHENKAVQPTCYAVLHPTGTLSAIILEPMPIKEVYDPRNFSATGVVPRSKGSRFKITGVRNSNPMDLDEFKMALTRQRKPH